MARSINRRSFFITAFLLVFLGGAFSVYYFIHIPRHKKQVEQYGFNVMQSIAASLQGRYNSLEKLPRDSPILFTPRGFELRVAGARSTKEVTPSSLQGVSRTMSQRFASASEDSPHFIFPIDSVMKCRTDFFSAFVLRDSAGRLLFDGEGLGGDLAALWDTAGNGRKQPVVAGIRRVDLRGQTYVIFSYAFRLGEAPHLYQLFGMLPEKTFNQRINYLPERFVYVTVILLLLLLLSVPFLKLWLMGKDEELSVGDIMLTFFTLFAGTGLVTLIVIHWLMMDGAHERSKGDLQRLAAQMQRSFAAERESIRSVLRNADNMMADRTTLLRLEDLPWQDIMFLKTKIDDKTYSTGIFSFFPYNYSNFDRIVWVDSAGNQRVKAERNPDRTTFINVADREYYRYFSEGMPVSGVNEVRGEMYFQAINSWNDGAFRMDVSMRSSTEYPVVVLATSMYTFMHTVLPYGYSFYLIDRKGDVQLNSGMDRILSGNLFQEVDARLIQAAVNARQEGYEERVLHNGAPFAMLVQPVAGTDYFLVMTHDSNQIMPVNLRILLFGLLISLMTALLFIFFLVVMRYRKIRSYRGLADYFKWMIPRLHLKGFYLWGAIVLSLYALFAMLAQFGRWAPDFVIFSWAVLSPLSLLLLLCGLFLYYFRNPRGPIGQRRFWLFLAWLAWMLAVFCYTEIVHLEELDRSGSFWWMPVGISIALVLMDLLRYGFRKANRWLENRELPEKWAANLLPYLRLRRFLRSMGVFQPPAENWDRRYFRQVLDAARKAKSANVFRKPPIKVQLINCFRTYNLLLLALLISLAVLPVTTFTWYGHNVEIRQEVKRQQLHTLKELQKRRLAVTAFWEASVAGREAYARPVQSGWASFAPIPAGLVAVPYTPNGTNWNKTFEVMQLQNGRYSIYADTMLPVYLPMDLLPRKFAPTEQFYYRVTDRADLPVPAQANYPGLGNAAADGSWYWVETDSTVGLLSRAEGIRRLSLDTARTFVMLHAKMPDRFVYLDTFRGLLLLAITVALLLALLYHLARMLTEQLFHANAIIIFYNRRQNVYKKDYDQIVLELEEDQLESENAYPSSPLLKTLLWDQLTDVQRVLVLDMATDGLINGKNLVEIGQLMQKGVLCINDGRLMFCDDKYRYFLLNMRQSTQVSELRKRTGNSSTWQLIQLPLLAAIGAIGIFFFLTQEDAFKRISLAVSSVAAMLPLLPKLFMGGGEKKAE